MEKYKPLGDRLIVKPIEAESKTKGGILIPSTAQSKVQRGTAIAVGKTCSVKEGDVVIYGKSAGTDIAEGLKVFTENQILTVVKED